MMDENRKPSRLRAMFKNAVVWGAGWGILGTAVAAVMRLNDNISPLIALLDGIGMGIRIGMVGGLAGAAFAGFISVAYRGKRISEISWQRFGLGGLVLGGLFVPAFIQTMSLLTGGGLAPFTHLWNDVLYSAVFGGLTAAGTMKLAQMDEEKNPVTAGELLDRMERQSLAAGEAPGFAAEQRARAAEQR
jgi:hypothetical protein